ncbi:MAG: hypothetical protein M1820_010490 [Bogoriella megaspora]|nr:MAG: hypothetical protein M1820_010490 [Bogoriella megaspora]
MSSSINIPKRKQPAISNHSASSSSSSCSSSSSSSTPLAHSHAESSSMASPPSRSASQAISDRYGRPRTHSLLGSSLSKSEHTVINVGGPENPRLITCVKASQGFDWNLDIFLPSYASDHDSSELEHRQDPVEDIVLTDEEAASIFPQ